MNVISAVEGHPLVVFGTVNSHAVLLALVVVVGLAVHPVCPGHGLPAWVDEASLPVEIVGTQPVGGEAEGPPVSRRDVLHDLVLLRLVLRLGQVAFVPVAALHGVEPGHPVSVEVSTAAPSHQ